MKQLIDNCVSFISMLYYYCTGDNNIKKTKGGFHMQIEIGKNIRALRKNCGRTQEALADALGVTSQAVSRWEAGGSYPDLEIVPSIANYFGITIDELFGYQCERDKKINAIIEKIDSFNIKARGDDEWVDECISLLRNGLAEFPQNEKLMITLADTLSEAGWRRHNEWLYYDDEGYIQHNYDEHQENKYWKESVKLCETLIDTTHDYTIFTRAINILVLLYRNFGETEKAVAYANRMPELKYCRELMLTSATDGKEEARYIGEALLKIASEFTQQLVYGLMNNVHHYESDMAIHKIKGAINLFYLICDDGNFGLYHGKLIQLYLYLSRIEWERGYHDDAFRSLDEALKHAKSLEGICDDQEHSYTSALVSLVKIKPCQPVKISSELPTDWPFWCNPDYSEVAKEMQADPRWEEWVKRTQQ